MDEQVEKCCLTGHPGSYLLISAGAGSCCVHFVHWHGQSSLIPVGKTRVISRDHSTYCWEMNSFPLVYAQMRNKDVLLLLGIYRCSTVLNNQIGFIVPWFMCQICNIFRTFQKIGRFIFIGSHAFIKEWKTTL